MASIETRRLWKTSACLPLCLCACVCEREFVCMLVYIYYIMNRYIYTCVHLHPPVPRYIICIWYNLHDHVYAHTVGYITISHHLCIRPLSCILLPTVCTVPGRVFLNAAAVLFGRWWLPIRPALPSYRKRTGLPTKMVNSY